MEQFRAHLEAWLAQTQTSQADLSRRSGVPQNVISRWLGKEPTRPSDTNLQKIAPVLGVSYEDLMRMCGYLPGKPHAQVGARRHIARDQIDRWLEAVGEENEEYFWADLKAKGDSTVRLIRQLRTAVSTGPEAPVSDASAERAKRGRQPRNGRNGPLGRSQHPARDMLAQPRSVSNERLAA